MNSSRTVRVHVCWSALRADASPKDWLDSTEQRRFDGLRQVEDQDRYLTSRVLLKTMVGRLAEASPALVLLSYRCPRCGRSHGRPVVVEPEAAVTWQVSLSHCGRAVMVAATDAGSVGVDVERAEGADFKGFDGVALTVSEHAEVERRPEQEQGRARAVYWVRKEAVLKATGHGLAVDPCALEVSAPDRKAALLAWRAADPPTTPVQILDVPVDREHVAAVAILAEVPCELELQPPPGSGRG